MSIFLVILVVAYFAFQIHITVVTMKTCPAAMRLLIERYEAEQTAADHYRTARPERARGMSNAVAASRWATMTRNALFDSECRALDNDYWAYQN